MKVAFLHTLTANQTLFDACIQESPLTEIADVIHRNAPELLQYASSVGLDDTLAKQVEQHILNLEEQGAEWIICTCSSIGHLAESSKTGSAQVIRVDRPMALAASQANGITVLAALKTTIEPTMNLLAEYQADIQQLAKVRVIDDAWQHYLDGCSERYQQTIADYIEQHCREDDSIVLAQASMAPAVKRLSEALQHKVLTSPALCIQYLIAQLAGE